MRRWTRLAVLALASALALVTLALTDQAGAAGSARGSKLVPGLLPGLSLATLRSPAAASQRLQIGVGISRPDPGAEVTLFDEVYDASSPEYHHFLTPAAFNARFGVAPATTAAVRSFLTGGGLTITSASAGGDYFTASGTVAQLENLFKVRIGDYAYKGDDFYANASAPSVPADLPISGVLGLESLSHFTPDAVSSDARVRTGVSPRAVHPAALGVGATATGGTEQTLTPQDLWGFYNAPGAAALTQPDGLSNPATLVSSSYSLGQGQIMGVFTDGEDSSVVRQLRLSEAALGLPKVPVRIVETEGGPDAAYGDNTGSVEWYLDSQSSTGMAPDVSQLDLYTAKTMQDADIAKEFDYWANAANGPREMNASFGECEETPLTPVTSSLANLPYGVSLGGEMENLADPALRQAALEGRTLFASAGDTGSGCPTLTLPVLGGANGLAIQPVPFQSYPCVSDYVVCVGGTTPQSAGAGYPAAAQRFAEPAWTFSGGGSSYFNPAPSFQQGIKNIDVDCVSNDVGTVVYLPGKAPVCRGVPDVADEAGGGLDAFFFYQDGQPSEEGGTSLASPLMMGQWARTQAAAPAATQAAGGLGFADPTIYKQAASADACTKAPCTGTYARDFFDVTQAEDVGDLGGQVGLPIGTGIGLSNGVYAPGPGWDYVSGWGALNDDNFIQDVDGGTDATDRYTGAEQVADSVCTASMTGPSGNATDPATETNDPGVDLTAATLSSSGPDVVASVTVPNLRTGAPVTSPLGSDFYVTWSYNGLTYYADAHESLLHSFTYSAGNTGPAFTKNLPNLGTYTNTATVTGSANTGTGVITITVPAADVGSPGAGAALEDPQAFSHIEVADLPTTVDSADTLRDASLDDGQLDSIGVNVIFDGTAGVNCSDTLSSTSLSTAHTGEVPSASSPTKPAGTKAAFSARQYGKLIELHVRLPAPARTYYFRWQLGVSFGTSRSLAYISKEIALYALPSRRRDALTITRLSKPHGRIAFALTHGTLSDFSFHLDPKYLYFSTAERADIKKHHLTRITGLFEVRSTAGVTYRETLTLTI